MIYTSPELLPNFALLNQPEATFHRLASYIQALPYKRISNRSHPELVIREKQGTCSSKHAFLASLAQEHGHPEIHLEIGIFEIVTPTLSFPEAHCYLVYEEQIFDFTHEDKSTIWNQQKPVERFVFQPNQIATKEHFHKEYVKQWAKKQHLDSEEVWHVRESYILAL